MNRGSAHQKVFLEDDDRDSFLTLLAETARMWGLQVHGFCLLDNHYHLLLHTPQGNLSRSMRHLDGVHTQRFNRRHRRDGSLFRGRFKSILIDADSYLLEVIRYIHLNPVRANLTSDPQDYFWSSHRAYLQKQCSLNWLIKDEVLGRFGTSWDQAIERYREFILEGVPLYVERFYTEKRMPVILGSERFKEWIKARFSEKRRADYELPAAKRFPFRPRLNDVINVVKQSYGVGFEVLRQIKRGKWNEARDVAIYLCRKECGLSLKEIGCEVSMTTYTTISMAHRRVEERLKKDLQFRQRMETLLKTLGG